MDPLAKDILTTIVPLAAFCLTLFLTVRSSGEKSSSAITSLEVKLDMILSDISDIKADTKSTKEDVDSIKERVVVVEQSTKSAHHRIDTLEKKLEKEIGYDRRAEE